MQELTNTGRDFNGWMSCDRKTVLFVRSAPEDPFTTSVYELDLPSKKERLLFDGSISTAQGETHYIAEPQMASDRGTLYVLARYDMSTGGVFAVDLVTRDIRHITDGAAFTIIQSGKHEGDFLVLERLTSIVGGIYYVYRLYSAEGKDLGLAGPKEMDLTSLGCSQPAAPERQEPAPSTAPVQPERKVLQVPPEIMATRLERRVEPDYAVPAGAAAIDRMVNLVVYISSEGTVTDAGLISGPPNLVPAAISAVRQWRYRPYEVDGKPVPVATTVNVQFRDTK